MTIQFLFNYLFTLRDLNVLGSKRPWAHRTKKGPGRKHQQTKTLTKEERHDINQG